MIKGIAVRHIMAYMQSFLCRFSPATAAFTCLMLVHGHVFSQSFNGAQAQADLALYRARLEELEERLGRYDPQLLEVLERIAQLTVELDQFDETDAILDRAIQILRISEGLNTDSQIPFLLLSARNNVRRDEWRDANETIGYLTELYNTVPRPLNDRLVNELI